MGEGVPSRVFFIFFGSLIAPSLTLRNVGFAQCNQRRVSVCSCFSAVTLPRALNLPNFTPKAFFNLAAELIGNAPYGLLMISVTVAF